MNAVPPAYRRIQLAGVQVIRAQHDRVSGHTPISFMTRVESGRTARSDSSLAKRWSSSFNLGCCDA